MEIVAFVAKRATAFLPMAAGLLRLDNRWRGGGVPPLTRGVPPLTLTALAFPLPLGGLRRLSRSRVTTETTNRFGTPNVISTRAQPVRKLLFPPPGCVCGGGFDCIRNHGGNFPFIEGP